MDRKELLAERRRLKSKVSKLTAALAAHETHLAKRLSDPSYRIGKYVDNLGAPAIGPCLLIEDKAVRQVLRDAVKRAYDWPEDAVLCHRCDTPSCAEPTHFFPGTHQDNMRDCALKGRWSRKVVARKELLAELRAKLTAVELVLGVRV